MNVNKYYNVVQTTVVMHLKRENCKGKQNSWTKLKNENHENICIYIKMKSINRNYFYINKNYFLHVKIIKNLSEVCNRRVRGSDKTDSHLIFLPAFRICLILSEIFS